MADRWTDYQGYVCADWLNDVDWLLVESAGTPRTPQQLRENIGAVEEAPIDGGEYVRQDGGWVANSGGGGAIAHNSTTDRGAVDAHPTAAITGLDTALGTKIEEAPVDSQYYVRIDQGWAVLPPSGVGPINHNETNLRNAADCHPTSAVTGLDAALTAKADVAYVDAGLAGKADTTDLDGKVDEAPLDGSQYGRQSGAWTQIVGGGGGGENNIQPNLLMNSGFHVNQRAAGTIDAPQATGAYSVDRWRWKTSSNIANAQLRIQSGTLNDDYSFHRNKALYYQQNSTDGALLTTHLAVLEHPIEGHDFRDTFFGESEAKTLTLSFTARYSESGAFTMSVGLQNAARNRSWLTTVAISNAKSKYSVQIPGATTGTWEKDSDVGAWLFFTFIAGSSHQRSVLNVWENNDDYAHNTQSNLTTALNDPKVYISDVKLEINSAATAYEPERQVDELLRCQRYYYSLTNTVIGAAAPLPALASNDSRRQLYVRWPTIMRSTPTCTIVGTVSGGGWASGMPTTSSRSAYGCEAQGDTDNDNAISSMQHLTADAEFTG